MHSLNQIGKIISYFLALGMVLAGIALSLYPVEGVIPPEADPWRNDLLDGVLLVSLGLLGLGGWFMALPHCLVWTLGDRLPKIKKKEVLLLLLLVLMAGLIRNVQAGSSLWWDELTALLRYIQRGFPVIFTFSGNCNNHILTSFFSKLCMDLFGEKEWVYRLPSLFFGLAFIASLYEDNLRLTRQRRAALFTAGIAIFHIACIVTSTEARGYAGALFFMLVSCYTFSRLLKSPDLFLMVQYLFVNTMAYGFIIHTILVPLSHGILVSFLWLHALKTQRNTEQGYRVLVWLAVGSGLLSLCIFGIQLPQAFTYLDSVGAARDHYRLSIPFLLDVLRYLSGTPYASVGAVSLVAALWGWYTISRSLPRVTIAFLAPVVLVLIWLLIPGQRFSMRLFFILLPWCLLGWGFFAAWLYGLSKAARGVLLCLFAGWAMAMVPQWRNYIEVGNPDLRGAAQRYAGQKIALTDQMADVITYYFKDASVYRVRPLRESDWLPLKKYDIIIRGTNHDKPVLPGFQKMGFELIEILPAWRDRHPEFRIYKKVNQKLKDASVQ